MFLCRGERKGLCFLPWGFAAAGVASGVAGAAASSAGGKKGSKQSRASEALSQQQANMAQQAQSMAVAQSSLTQPLRSGTVNTLNNFLQSGVTPNFLDLNAQVAPTRQLATLSLPGIQQQQADSRRQLLNSGVRGGMIGQGLAQGAIQAGLQRANVLQGLSLDDILRQEQRDTARTGIAQNLFGMAGDLGTGGLTQAQQGFGQAMSGLGGAAGNLNSLGAQQIQQNTQTQQALGSLAGKGLGYGASQYLPAYGAMNANKYGSGSNAYLTRGSTGGVGLTGGR